MRHPHAVISGGSSGIGLALARRLAIAGWNLTVMARGRERLDAAREAIENERRQPDQQVMSVAADVTDNAEVDVALASAISAMGAPELLVANAGIVIPGRFVDLTMKSFRRTMEVNYFGTLNFIRAGLPAMRANRKGRVVIMSSGAGLIGLYGYTAYASSKFAVRGLAEALRSELKPDGVEVSVVYPPDTDTPQLREEIRMRPVATSRIAGGAKTHTADQVAASIMNGIAKNRFIIAPGFEMAALAHLHSVLAPTLNRFWFDRVVARWHDVERDSL